MYIKPQIFNIAACAGEGSRYALGGVALQRTPAGPVAVATNGRILLVVKFPELPEDKAPEGLGDAGKVENFSTTIPVDAAKTLAKRIKTNKPDVLVEEPSANGTVHAATLNGKMEFKSVEGIYPKWQQVVPNFAIKAPVKITLNPEYLATLCSAIVKASGGECNSVTLEFVPDEKSPAKLTGRNTAGGDGETEYIGVIMPIAPK